jgi:excisionase family DNA binding protein
MQQVNDPLNKTRLAYGVDEAAHALSISRARLYELIGAGEIGICKVGKRTLIPAVELYSLLDRHRADKADTAVGCRDSRTPPPIKS